MEAYGGLFKAYGWGIGGLLEAYWGHKEIHRRSMEARGGLLEDYGGLSEAYWGLLEAFGDLLEGIGPSDSNSIIIF